MKKLFISMAIVCAYTHPAAWDTNLSTIQFDEGPHDPISNRSSAMSLKSLFFKELEQIRKEKPDLIDPKNLIQRAYAKVEEQRKKDSDNLITPLHFGLSIRDLIDHNLIPKYLPEGDYSQIDFSNMYINDLDGAKSIKKCNTRYFLSENRS